jgi:hepatitis B virus X-interacting protein
MAQAALLAPVDAPFTAALKDIASQVGVLGVLFTDKNGLLLGAAGDVDLSLAGYLTSVVAQATKVQPTVSVTTPDGKLILVHKENEMTIAIFKKNEPSR